MIQELIQQAKEGFKTYIQQMESVDAAEIESYFESVLYRELVDLYRKHNADDATIAGYVRAFNDFADYQLNLHYFKKELAIISTRPCNEQKRKLPNLEQSITKWLANNKHVSNDVEMLELLSKVVKACEESKK